MDAEQEMKLMEAELGHDGWKKVGAISRILEIGSPNIAQSEKILKTCQRVLELISVTGS